MKISNVLVIFAAIALFVPALVCGASTLESLRKGLSHEYPPDRYLLGVGESRRTGSDIRDFRVAEVLARRDIAQQVRVEVNAVDLDFQCGGSVGKAYGDREQCRDEYISIIQASTNEFLSGSRVVERSKDDENVYVIVAIPRSDMAAKAREARSDAIKETRESMKKAATGQKDAPDEAREALLRARAYDRQARAMEDIRENADELFSELEAELERLK
ncbi:LPP20 family lipoprotein [Nitrospirota bacterium]